MKNLCLKKIDDWYKSNFENKLRGRRILFEDIDPILKNLSSNFKKEIIGYSEENIPIYKISIGTGKIKVLVWSQMHGNESTGTKALFDLFRLFDSDDIYAREISESILNTCKLEFIVLLNPDGAINFTRENANNIDLNRDAVDKNAVESKILRRNLDSFKPKFCFNLHDQRSIFNVKGTKNPATISFLAPSEDVSRTLTNGRKECMSVIVSMNKLLQEIIPNQVGRYTDEFYPTATGDNFQKLGYNTILFEAGHFKDDYEREITRKINFYAILQALMYISCEKNYSNFKPYFNIPENDKFYLDIIYKNVIDTDNSITNIGVQKKFRVKENILESYKCIEIKGDLSNYATNKVINTNNIKIYKLKLSNS